MTSNNSNENVDEKYQKLSVEFAKLRNEIPNLREKLDEEKNKNSELYEEIRKRDVTIRKFKSDNESLSFRNEQLSKRVETLQSSLDSTTATFAQAKAKKKHKEANLRIFGTPAMEPSTSDLPVNSSQLVIEQELERKLAENANLHTQLYDMEKQHETVVLEFSSIVKKLEAENELLKKKLLERPQIDDDKELAEIISNGYTNIEEKESIKDVLLDLLNNFQQGLESLSTMFTHIDTRSTIYPCDATLESVPESIHLFGLLCGKISEELKDMRSTVAMIHMRLGNDENSSMSELKDNLFEIKNKFGLLLKESMPELSLHLSTCIRKECDAPWCNFQLDQLNSQYEKAFIQSLYKLSYLLNVSNDNDVNISSELIELRKIFHKLRDIFGKKIFIENHLPTTSRKLKQLNDNIDKSLLQFVQIIGKLQQRFNDKDTNDLITSTLFGKKLVENGKENGKKLSVLEKQASVIEESQTRLRTLQTRLTDSKDIEEKLTNELHQLRQELAQKDVKIANLECKIVVLEKQMEVLKGSMADINEIRANILQNKSLDDYSVLEYYFCNELNKTVTELETVKATVARYRKDIDDMTLILQKLDVEQHEYNVTIESKNEEVQKLRDELETTKQSYEEQIRVMSDHLAALNAKIIEKSEKLVQLNGESANGSSGSSSGGSLIRKMVRK